ncbi:MAG: DUF302 domain-containing protein [Zoogloea sp.]|uniref:DUF302 domain-containing protein n=1 Tax=Zoogloea sp. TaxID=49181 RepID=UPI003F304185
MRHLLLKLILPLALLPSLARASNDIDTLSLHPARYADAREALVDAIEGEGLVPAPPSRFGEMLARTGKDLGQPDPVYEEAEVLHFCSAPIAWQLARANPANIAGCPLSMAIYTLPGEDRRVHLAWHIPQGNTPAHAAARQLLTRIAQQTRQNAGRSSLNP